MRVCLFEDGRAGGLEPLALTRPVFELLCGLGPLRDRQCLALGAAEVGVLVRPFLADLYRATTPGTPVNDPAWLRAAPVALINGRWLPAEPAARADGPCVGLCDDEVAYAVVQPELLPTEGLAELEGCLELWRRTLPVHDAGGRMVRYPWDLVRWNAERICSDWQMRGGCGSSADIPHLQVLGPRERVRIAAGARVEPFVLIDATAGPVVIERDAVVSAFTRLEGPCRVGPGTHLLGAKVRAGTTLGPQCRIGGEVECSIVQGHSNKYHDGFLGHAYVGEWVNLGAGTSNSDLRNDYGEVTVTVLGRRVATGQTKVGCFLGDHTKAGLGTLLNTGTSAGIFCNLLPSGGLLPRHVPSFASWWNGALVDRADLSELLRTAGVVMSRRGAVLTEAHALLYRRLYEETAAERRQAVRDAERRQLRRTA